jgi:ribosomal protein S27AE
MDGIERCPAIWWPKEDPSTRVVGDQILCGRCGGTDWLVMEAADKTVLLLECCECELGVVMEASPDSNEKNPDGETYRVGPRGLYGGGD